MCDALCKSTIVTCGTEALSLWGCGVGVGVEGFRLIVVVESELKAVGARKVGRYRVRERGSQSRSRSLCNFT